MAPRVRVRVRVRVPPPAAAVAAVTAVRPVRPAMAAVAAVATVAAVVSSLSHPLTYAECTDSHTSFDVVGETTETPQPRRDHVLVTVTFERTFSFDRSSPASTNRFGGGESLTRRVWGRWVADLARGTYLAF